MILIPFHQKINFVLSKIAILVGWNFAIIGKEAKKKPQKKIDCRVLLDSLQI